MKRMRAAVAAAWITVLADASAQTLTPPALVTDGCGSGRIGFLVPNSTWLSACQFQSACDRHDLCYGRCLLGGDLAGNATCSAAEAKTLRRQTCDVSLQRDIVADNPGRPVCSLYASVYRLVVQLMGEQFFHGIGGSPRALGQLSGLLAYLEQNPDAFDLVELEQAFAGLADRGVAGVEYEFWLFKGNPPLLVARQEDREIFKVRGRERKP
jgi:hypothetical protein